MSYLLDTNIVSLTHKKHLPARLEKWLMANEAESFISTVTLAEMKFGAEIAPASHRAALIADVEKTESIFSEALEPVSLECLLEWKRVAAFLKQQRRTIGCEDSLIAAQCLAHGHAIVTNNTAHFKILEPMGLRVVNPLA
jgi:predicted nucleic acid-binding protein